MDPDRSLLDARAAAQAGAWREAKELFETACRLEQTAAAMDGLGEALWWLGEPRDAVTWRARAYTQWRRDGEHLEAGLAAIGIAVVYWANFANAPAAAGWIAHAERASAQIGGALDGWTWVTRAYLGDDADVAVELCQRALKRARSESDPDGDLELCALSGLGQALVSRGETAQGMALIDEAMAGVLAGDYQRLDTAVYVCCDMLVSCHLAADVTRARQWCELVDQLTARVGCPYLYARCRTLYGATLVATGHWELAASQLRQAIRMAHGAGPAIVAEAHAMLADLLVRQGKPGEAEQLLRGHDSHLVTLRPRAGAALAVGNAALAVALLERRLWHPTKFQADDAAVLALLTQAHLKLGNSAAASLAAQRLRALPAATRPGYVKALATLATGGVDGDADALAEAADAFASLGLAHEAAQARLQLARHVSPTHTGLAITEATAALDEFRRLGASLDAEAAGALLRALGVAAARATPVGNLTEREQEVLALLALGLSNPEIAGRLFIARKTASHHVSSILAKLGLRNRAEAVAYALRANGST